MYTTDYVVEPSEVERLVEDTHFDFAYHGRNNEMFNTWSIGPVVKTRDSGNLMASNTEVLLERLKGYEDDWEVISCSHWACGWVEHLTFRAREEPQDMSEIDRRLAEIEQGLVTQAQRRIEYEGHGTVDKQSTDEWAAVFQAREEALLAEQRALLSEKHRLEFVPTTVCRIVCEWDHQIEDQTVLDEDDLCKREFESTLENLESIAQNLRDNLPQGWVYELHRWLSHHYPSAMSGHDFDGAWPDCEVVQEGLAALGYLEEDADATV